MILPRCFIPERVKEPLLNVPMARHIDVPRAKENRNGSKSCHGKHQIRLNKHGDFLIAKNTWKSANGAWTLVDATIFQDIYSTTTLQIENLETTTLKSLNSNKNTIYTHIFLQQTHSHPKYLHQLDEFRTESQSGLRKTFETHMCSNLSNFYPQIKHLYSPPRFSMVFQIWSPWCFCFPTLLHLRIFWKRKCFFFFFRVKNCMLNLVMLGGHFPSKSSQTNSHSQPPLDQVEGRLVQAQVKEKTKSGTSNSIKRFLGWRIPEKQWGWCHLLDGCFRK